MPNCDRIVLARARCWFLCSHLLDMSAIPGLNQAVKDTPTVPELNRAIAELKAEMEWKDRKLAYFEALAEFQSQTHFGKLTGHDSLRRILEYLETYLPDVQRQLFTDAMVEQLVTTIQFVIAFDAGESVGHIDAKMMSKSKELHQLRRYQARASIYIDSILTTLNNHKRLRDLWINTPLLNKINHERGYLSFGKPLSNKWTFYPGQFEVKTQLSTEMKEIKFTHLQHVVHSMEDVIKILTEKVGLACFQGKTHRDYYGPHLWWLAAKPPARNDDRYPTLACPSLECGDSRYGSVRFSFPIKIVMGRCHDQRYPPYLLGTRHYSNEWAHTIMLTSKAVRRLKLDEKDTEVPTVDLTNSPVVNWQPGATEATWNCYRSDRDNWDHLEFACEIPENEVRKFDPSKGEVRIDFVTHNDYCVSEKRPVNRNYKYQDDLLCKCASSNDAARLFVAACHAKDPNLLDKLHAAGFFDADVWRQVQRVSNPPANDMKAASTAQTNNHNTQPSTVEDQIAALRIKE